MDPETSSYLFTAPVVETPWTKLGVALVGLAVTLIFSGYIIRYFILPRGFKPATPTADGPRFDSSVIIGKCENFLVFVFVLLKQESGLAIIFAAKALARTEDIKKNPGFFLGGTLVNLVWALIVAYITRLLIQGL